MSAFSLVTSEASMAGTPRPARGGCLAWKAAAIATSLPLMSGSTKAIAISRSAPGSSSELLRSNTDPALNFFGGATGVTCTTRPCFSCRLTRASSGV